MSKNADLLNRAAIYPSTNYPGRTQEGVLTHLLRKKLEPQVETWVEEGRSTHTTVIERGTDEKAEDELLEGAMKWLSARIRTYAEDEADDNYTFEERDLGIENVRTGLRRKLEDDSSSDDASSADEETEDVGVAVTAVRRSSMGEVEYGLGQLRKDPNGKSRNIEDLLRFGASGIVAR